MKKMLYMIAMAVVILSCATDNLENLDNAQRTSVQTIEDNSIIGTYIGVFTTNDSKHRATVELTIPAETYGQVGEGTFPTATITTVKGEVYYVKADRVVKAGRSISELEFRSEDLSFEFSVNDNGTKPVVSNVMFKNAASNIIIAKNSERVPVTPITGTYEVTISQGHPALNNAGLQTFNLMFVGAPTGNTSVTTQVVLGGTTYSGGIGVQNSCSAFGNYTTCETISGNGANNVGFMVDGKAVTWEGIHRFNNQTTGPNDCSGAIGTWEFNSGYGLVSGIYESDAPCFRTFTRERFQPFRGLGFQPGIVAGYLNSNVVRANGLSDGPMAFGDTRTTGDFARGNSTGNVTTAGVYSFQVSGGNYALGIQPDDTDFTPGNFEFKVLNNSGAAVSTVYFSYRLFVRNNASRSNSLNFSYSVDGITYIPVPSLDFTSNANPDGAGWKKNKRKIHVNASVPAGGFIYFKFSGDDVSGTGERDEFAIDNILVQAK